MMADEREELIKKAWQNLLALGNVDFEKCPVYRMTLPIKAGAVVLCDPSEILTPTPVPYVEFLQKVYSHGDATMTAVWGVLDHVSVIVKYDIDDGVKVCEKPVKAHDLTPRKLACLIVGMLVSGMGTDEIASELLDRYEMRAK